MPRYKKELLEYLTSAEGDGKEGKEKFSLEVKKGGGGGGGGWWWGGGGEGGWGGGWLERVGAPIENESWLEERGACIWP